MRYPQILALESAPSEVAYSRRDAILYALSVGAGAQGLDEAELSFVYEKDLRTLPTMSTLLLGKDNTLLAQAGVDFRKVLHSGQRLRMHHPLPPEGRLLTRSRVTGVADKGKEKGAVVDVEHAIRDAATDLLYATVTLTLFCRGDGGFGGPSQDGFVAHPPPNRPADREIRQATLPNQAALYRLSMGDTNPLHIDPVAAAAAGFDRPLLHGLCTYGFACRAVIQAYCGGDPAKIAAFDVRFAAPFFPGETLVTRTWRDGPVVAFECASAERGAAVFTHGRCEILD